ncbi:MAG: flagellin [Defluviitaleaceae bacterium]|nr:flagellin [Defluviitaleaceae bacterium]
MRVNHNMPALLSGANIGRAESRTALAMRRLSSGFRINSSMDDPAGMSITNRMSKQIAGTNQANHNSMNGISIVQTAEGGLQEMHNILQRMRELTIQANNDTTVPEDRVLIHMEINQLSRAINEMAISTQFNGINLLAQSHFGIGTSLANATHVPNPGALNLPFITPDPDLFPNDTATHMANPGSAGRPFVLADPRRTPPDTGTHVVNDGRDHVYIGTGGDYEWDGTAFIPATGGAGTGTHTYPNPGGAFIPSDVVRDEAGTHVANPPSALDQFIAQANGDYVLVGGAFVPAPGGSGTGTHNRNSEWRPFILPDTDLNAADEATHIRNNGRSFVLPQPPATTAHATHRVEDPTLLIQIGPDMDMQMRMGLVDARSHLLGSADLTIADIGNIGEIEDALALFIEDGMNGTHYRDSILISIDIAIHQISEMRSTFGSYQNRLEHTVTSLGVKSENLSTARMRLRDTDMAAEMTELSSSRVMEQAGLAILAQANQRPQQILQLIQ